MTMTTTTGTGAVWSPAAVRPLTGFAVPSHYLDRPAAPRRAVVAHEPTCTCGQALDCSHTAHCPRCGITLRH
jgi:hypothetical protein